MLSGRSDCGKSLGTYMGSALKSFTGVDVIKMSAASLSSMILKAGVVR